jgi:hypothetical protein
MDQGEQLQSSADTNIFVTPAPRTPVQPISTPEFRPSPAVYQPVQSITNERTVSAPRTVKKTSVNWGGVIKGVAIVGAVVLVGVGAYYGFTAASAWVLNQPIINSVLGSVSSFMQPITLALTNAGQWLLGFGQHLPGIFGGFFGQAFGMAGGAGAVASAGLSATAVSATASTVGTVAAGSTLIATAPLAVAAMKQTTLLNHDMITTMPDAPQPDISVPDAPAHISNRDVAADLATLNSNALATQNHARLAAEHNMHVAADLGLHSHHLAAHKLHAVDAVNNDGGGFIEQLLHSKKQTLASNAQHDDANSSQDDANVPDADVDDANLLKGKRQGRSWKDRLMGATSSYSHTLNASGSHSEAVMANRTQPTSITPRASEFSTALNDDRARLDAALGEPSRN